ncbi:MAG: hypothetical protein COW00_08765 [Bdellovibrio sp. CG12_big_fil_rev_8_21_14_0_65_39_13]|nr:MAG: hypothetical protein COW78_08835 [Bdellovibrio sp. CG22_combo_CG10-13_8_21_14_all_39_27]PIQ59715.1 MAG: hypothetical protein COW00_08765 [Bdellovibrio sp. CG12_big_fil_rev_8_21_14_0_65_39_13]PIR36255.1 MAG: hypothetical protein COV37_04620 [Bdellovibrio sp. CG11_big_fil_rev_8_21_14_0_20_39_38]
MGMNTGNKKGAISDINVTPLVDVMLVLLVIFMITAPLMLNGISLELPKTKEVNPLNLSTTQIVLSLTRSEELFIGKDKILESEIIAEIKSKFKQNKTDVIYLRADYGIKYGSVAKLMSFLKRGGITNIALVTEIETNE